MMELQLGLPLPTDTDAAGSSRQVMMNQGMLHSWLSTGADDNFSSNHHKRSFYDAFGEINDVPPTLPLLLWSKQPDGEEDDGHDKNLPFALNKVDEDGDGIVGWPPIKFRRRKISHRSKENRAQNSRTVDNGCVDCHGRASKSMYVKVKMEGVAIGRKINLSLYQSFQALKLTLHGMFGIRQEDSSSYKLAFQDNEGDWLLADDVSWRSFIRSVQRLKLVRRSR